MNDELRNFIRGTQPNSTRNTIQTALFYLKESKRTGRKAEKTKLFDKKDEIAILREFASQNNLWFNKIDKKRYIGEGAEQKVYLDIDGQNVIKTNDGIFYEYWEDYFISLMIHNYLFRNTAYQLIGFHENNETFYAVVKQPFVASTQPTDLELLRIFLEFNGFIHKKNNDYLNYDLGIILEDLHDENVLTNQGVFFFIDSAIYLINPSEI